MHIVLWALQSPINIGMILRSAEVYRTPVTIFDQHAVFQSTEAVDTIADFACGALQRSPPEIWNDAQRAKASLTGCLVATAIEGNAQPLNETVFSENDHVLLGNEYDGLPDQLLAGCDKRIRIPMPSAHLPKPPSRKPIDPLRSASVKNGGMPSLNVAVAASIIMSAAYGFLSVKTPARAPRASSAGG